MNKLYLFLLMIFLFKCPVSAQIILSEVMFDPDTLEYYCEYIEIYNISEESVNLENWTIGSGEDMDLILPADAAGGTVLAPESYALILDPGYFENELRVYDWPVDDCVLLTIEDASFGSGGLSNSQSDTIIICNPQWQIVQQYCYSLDNSPGYSDEKIDLQGSNAVLNWSNSSRFRGTPGYDNTVMIPDYNLKAGMPYILDNQGFFYIINTGITEVHEQISFDLFLDLDFDEEFSEGMEKVCSREIHLSLNPGDSINVELEIPNRYAGSWPGKVIVSFSDDCETDNISYNILTFDVTNKHVVLNELMISPEDSGEWIELYNSSMDFVSLHELKIMDTRDTILLERMTIPPEGYLILCQEETWVQVMQSAGIQAMEISWATLNNTMDHFKISDPQNFLVDEAYYDVGEMNIDLRDGFSLERIKPFYSGRDIWNWAVCVDIEGHTCGRENSLRYQPVSRGKKLTAFPNPFSPDDDGMEDICQISLQTGFELMNAQIKIFSLDGKMIKQWKFNRIPGNYTVVWNGKGHNGRKQALGVYIIYAEMVNHANGKKIKEKKSVVIAYKK